MERLQEIANGIAQIQRGLLILGGLAKEERMKQLDPAYQRRIFHEIEEPLGSVLTTLQGIDTSLEQLFK